MKPMGRKNYGTIAHLPGSRMGQGDHKCHEGQAKIATEKARDKHDWIIVQEKLDGSNVGVYRQDDMLFPLTRAGYVANTSPYEQHWKFYNWVFENQDRFLALLENGERAVGEWLYQAHGTRYNLPHEPFVLFDIMRDTERELFLHVVERIERNDTGFVLPHVVWTGAPCSIEKALSLLDPMHHGAIDPIEGAVWRVERNRVQRDGTRKWHVDFLVKYVRPDKQDGIYLPDISGNPPIYNISKKRK